MPVNLSIKGVPDSVAAALRARAARNHRSLQRELMAIVETAAARPEAFTKRAAAATISNRAPADVRPIEEIAQELRKLFPHSRNRGPSSVDIIRAMRDGRIPQSGRRQKGSR